MWRKRDLIIASVVIVALISASVGFYELGLNQGKDLGYQNGFSQGSSSTIIQSFTQIQMLPNNTVLINTQPFSANNITVVYSFFVSGAVQNKTVDMSVSAWEASGPGKALFSTNYQSNDSGNVYLPANNLSQLVITFRASPHNSGTVDLVFNSPLRIVFN